MRRTRGKSTLFAVRGVDPDTVEDIRRMAERFHVPQGAIVEEAVAHIEWVWATHTGLPEYFRRPRDW